MYWPLGAASTFQVPEYGHDEDTGDETPSSQNALVSLSRTSSGNLLATLTVEELHLWQTQVYSPFMVVLSVIADGCVSFSPAISNFSADLRQEH